MAGSFPPETLVVAEWRQGPEARAWLEGRSTRADDREPPAALYQSSDDGPSRLISLIVSPIAEQTVCGASQEHLLSSLALTLDSGVLKMPAAADYPFGPVVSLSIIDLEDEGVVDEFNEWYRTEHLPDAMACPGFLAGARYRCASPTRSVTFYVLDGESAMVTREINAVRGFGPFADRLRQTRTLYRPVRR